MNTAQIQKLIEIEFEEKNFGVSEQLLEIHKPIFENNKIKIANIKKNTENISAYIPVQNEKFYFVVYLDINLEKIIAINTEPYICVYFNSNSETLTLEELKNYTKLKPTKTFKKGDLRKNTQVKYKFNAFQIEPSPEPDNFENKLKNLLDFLQTDRNGIKKLVENANGYIQVSMEIHNGNGMIGGPNINKENIRKLSELGLSIDFDLYVSGNEYK